jgi:uncharacterized small protein (DUF1192 family)
VSTAPQEPRPDLRADLGADLTAELAGRPVAEHVAVLEAEHARLQAELASIDRL